MGGHTLQCPPALLSALRVPYVQIMSEANDQEVAAYGRIGYLVGWMAAWQLAAQYNRGQHFAMPNHIQRELTRHGWIKPSGRPSAVADGREYEVTPVGAQRLVAYTAFFYHTSDAK